VIEVGDIVDLYSIHGEFQDHAGRVHAIEATPSGSGFIAQCGPKGGWYDVSLLRHRTTKVRQS
jgi:hypothetical protein